MKEEPDKKPEEEVCEIYEVEKDGKTDVKKSCGSKEIEDGDDEEVIDKENKLLRNVLICIGAVIAVFLISYFIAGSMKTFDYYGVKVDIVDEVAPYRIGVPVVQNGNVVPYYFYLRKDPRVVDENVPFSGEIYFNTAVKKMVINGTEFDCEGDGVIAVANMIKLYNLLGIEAIKDENATCDSQGRYMFVNFAESDETSIEQTGPACYQINVANCEVLEATEKFMLETFVEIDKLS